VEDLIAKLDRIFNPRVVAVVGDKKLNRDYMWLRAMEPFKGRVYSVNIDPNEVPGIEALGIKNYLSLMDIPEPVDYVVVSVPREVTPIIIRDCIKAGVGGAGLFTSGFAETKTEVGIKLQETITQMAKDANFALVGPNCMGLFIPKLGVRNSTAQYAGEAGDVGFVSQSGTHSINFSIAGYAHGIKISKLVSYGNAVVLDSSDYLEYLAQDSETKAIGMYIEGVKDGGRFFRLLRETVRQKPVVIWKGGQTEAGTRATSSHTNSLAESMTVWEAIFKQTGALRADNMEEMIDTFKALLYCKPPIGDRVGLVSMTGGQSVVITDAFAKAGLQVPTLSQQSYDRLASFFNIIGGSYRNPIDMGSNWRSADVVAQILDIMDKDENIDAVALELSVNFLPNMFERIPGFEQAFLGALDDFKERSSKPLVIILPPLHADALAADFRDRLMKRGLPAFPSFARAARALNSVVKYEMWKRDGE